MIVSIPAGCNTSFACRWCPTGGSLWSGVVSFLNVERPEAAVGSLVGRVRSPADCLQLGFVPELQVHQRAGLSPCKSQRLLLVNGASGLQLASLPQLLEHRMAGLTPPADS